MSITLFAQPYDIAAAGFYFEDKDIFLARSGALRNDYGQPVEEFEIQFTDGEAIDAELAKAWDLHQGNFVDFLRCAEEWQDYQKQAFIIAVGEVGYDFDPASVDPDAFEVDIYYCDSLKELAEQFVDEGLFGEIPDHLAHYIDHDAIARDLSVDFSETEIAGTRLIYASR